MLLAAAAESVDVLPILQAQREATMERLQRMTRMKAKADPDGELAWTLLLDALTLDAETELRWLDRCEQRIRERQA